MSPKQVFNVNPVFLDLSGMGRLVLITCLAALTTRGSAAGDTGLPAGLSQLAMALSEASLDR